MGSGALLYAEQYPEDVAGICLIAPFLGSRGTIKEIQDSGGLVPRGRPENPFTPDDYQRALCGRGSQPTVGMPPDHAIPSITGYGTDGTSPAPTPSSAMPLPLIGRSSRGEGQARLARVESSGPTFWSGPPQGRIPGRIRD